LVPIFSIGLSSLAGGRGKKIVAKLPKWFLGAWTVALHTVIIDDFIATALQDGVDTVLNLGAGLDTRPYRMPLRRTCNGSKSIIRMSSHGRTAAYQASDRSAAFVSTPLLVTAYPE
jgi:hypothetical protein